MSFTPPPTYPAYRVFYGHYLNVTGSQVFLGQDGRSAAAGSVKGSDVATNGYDGVWATQFAHINNAGVIGGGNGGSSNLSLASGHSAAADGGIGIVFAKGGDLNNTGGISVIYGGAGGHSTFGAGGAGGTGVVFDGSSPSDVTNTGLILGGNGGNSGSGPGGAGGIGIVFSADGNLKNYSSISGGDGGNSNSGVGGTGGAGVVFDGSAVVTNYGSISGGYGGTGTTNGGVGGNGITFNGTGLLTNAGGSSITGGNAGLDNLAGDGVLLRSGGSITDAGLIEGGNGATLEFLKGGGLPAGAGVVLTDGGSVYVEQGGVIEGGKGVTTGAVGVYLRDGGTLDVEHGGTVMGGAGGSGYYGGAGVFLSGGTLIAAGKIEGGGTGSYQGDSVDFGRLDATMFVDKYAQFSGAIGNFHYGDTVDFTNLSASYIENHFNPLTDTITTTLDGTLQFAGDPHLIFSSDGEGGTLVTCACFRRGTRILTEHGERPVEVLEIGDRVMTLSGELRSIRWIGRRHYSGQALFDRPDVMPVLVRAGALGNHLPRRDLWVSPEHALHLNGALVPAALLTNGVSILTDDSVSSVSYYHLEFESHEVVFAEGAPAESFVDDDSRQMFDNAADYAFRYPDAPRQSAIFCGPRVEDGEELQALRVQLAAIASIPAPIRALDLSTPSQPPL